jgi:hypothetical protein
MVTDPSAELFRLQISTFSGKDNRDILHSSEYVVLLSNVSRN